MASRIDTSKVTKGFRRAARNESVAQLAVAVMQKPWSDGLAAEFARRQGGMWKPNAPKWRYRKLGVYGGSGLPLERTGALRRAMTNNAPSKLGSKGGVKLGVNWRNSIAYSHPITFTDHKGKKLPPKGQRGVLRLLRRGSATANIRAHAEKKGMTLRDALSASYGPSSTQRERALGGSLGTPARPFLYWEDAWNPEVEKDLDKAIGKIFEEQGFLVRVGLRDAR
jgi:hypothetical protein